MDTMPGGSTTTAYVAPRRMAARPGSMNGGDMDGATHGGTERRGAGLAADRMPMDARLRHAGASATGAEGEKSARTWRAQGRGCSFGRASTPENASRDVEPALADRLDTAAD